MPKLALELADSLPRNAEHILDFVVTQPSVSVRIDSHPLSLAELFGAWLRNTCVPRLNHWGANR